MGAWGYKVLSNDYALDVMDEIVDADDIKAYIKNIFQNENSDIYELLLAVEIVDISLNGIDKEIIGEMYGYDAWFKSVEAMDMKELVKCSIDTIDKLIKIDNGWVENVREDRRQLLHSVKRRLLSAKETN